VPVTIAVEFAQAGTSSWTALTCDVFGLGWARGASEDRGVMAVPESGELSVYMIDPARDLDPANPSSVYAGKWDLGAQVRVTMSGAVRFTGTVDDIGTDLAPPPSPGLPGMPITRFSVINGVALAAGVQSVTNAPYPQESTMARIGHLLDGAGIATGVGQRTIDAGGEPVQAAAGLTNDVWSDLLAIVQNELGSIEFRADGSVVARTRHTVWTPSAPVLHLGCDDPDSSAELALSNLRLHSQRSTIRNRVDAARAGGTAIVKDDAPSQARYGLRATQRHDLVVMDDTQVDAWAAFALNRARNPSRGLENAKVDASDAGVALIEAVPLFTGRVHVYQDHYGSAAVDRVVRLLGVAWSVDAQANATATLTLGQDTAPVPTARAFSVDSTVDWLARMGGAAVTGGWTGSVGWKIDPTGVLRTYMTSQPSESAGGVDAITITWTSTL
jgi:hypothetical protein